MDLCVNDKVIAVVTDNSTMYDYLHITDYVRITPDNSLALQQINNRFDFPFCSPTHTVAWHNYHRPLPPALDVACGNVQSLPNVAAATNFIYMPLFKTNFFHANTQNYVGLAGGYDPVGRNANRHIIGFGEIDHEPVGVMSSNGEQVVVSEVALILGNSDIHVIEISIQ